MFKTSNNNHNEALGDGSRLQEDEDLAHRPIAVWFDLAKKKAGDDTIAESERPQRIENTVSGIKEAYAFPQRLSAVGIDTLGNGILAAPPYFEAASEINQRHQAALEGKPRHHAPDLEYHRSKESESRPGKERR